MSTIISRPESRVIDPYLGRRWWMLLIFHAGVFVLFVFNLPRLDERFPDVLRGNLAHLLIPVWGGLLLMHLVMIVILEFRAKPLRARSKRIEQRLRELRSESRAASAPEGTLSDS